MRKGLLVPLVISIALHVVLVGAAELFSGPSGGAVAGGAAVSYEGHAGKEAVSAGKDEVPEPAAPPPGGSLSIETSDPRYRPYFSEIRRDIENTWRTPSPHGSATPAGSLVLIFTLGSDGRLRELSVHQSSGERELDFSAVESVKSAAPFRPFPADIAEDKITVRARFVYN